MPVRAFRIAVPEETLADLRERIARTRWPDEIAHSNWDYGTNRAYLEELLEYWRNGFDWRAQESFLNSFSHFLAPVDGLNLHFIHERGRGPEPMPLVAVHGWPSTFFEMSKIVPLLTNPAAHGGDPRDSFDVVAPSLPGCGFSERPRAPGMHKTRMAELFAKLMSETLGYRRFAARGGDIGAGVVARLAMDYPERVIGLHVSDVVRPYLGPGARTFTDAERRFFEEERLWMEQEGAYDYIQATKPQTLGYGLNDSPAGLAAWIVEKYRSWSDCGGDVERRFTKDEILTQLTLYWVTETINSANRLYYERNRHPRALGPDDRVRVPTAVAIFPADIDKPPREWGERVYDVARWTVMPRGGHFAALEEPELLARDIREFFRPLRERVN
ncbi:MAG: epoxide hydrolase [Acidobacteriota bacterium]|nr:epoxide hydrolase [Acidobacteriota bacterium]MDQ5872925.1 epoxide hydrolase [Acidobacteriota bacterium]